MGKNLNIYLLTFYGRQYHTNGIAKPNQTTILATPSTNSDSVTILQEFPFFAAIKLDRYLSTLDLLQETTLCAGLLTTNSA